MALLLEIHNECFFVGVNLKICFLTVAHVGAFQLRSMTIHTWATIKNYIGLYTLNHIGDNHI